MKDWSWPGFIHIGAGGWFRCHELMPCFADYSWIPIAVSSSFISFQRILIMESHLDQESVCRHCKSLAVVSRVWPYLGHAKTLVCFPIAFTIFFPLVQNPYQCHHTPAFSNFITTIWMTSQSMQFLNIIACPQLWVKFIKLIQHHQLYTRLWTLIVQLGAQPYGLTQCSLLHHINRQIFLHNSEH